MVDRTEMVDGTEMSYANSNCFYFLFLFHLDPSPKITNLSVIYSVYIYNLIFFFTCRNLSLLSFISLKVLVHVWRATEYFWELCTGTVG